MVSVRPYDCLTSADLSCRDKDTAMNRAADIPDRRDDTEDATLRSDSIDMFAFSKKSSLWRRECVARARPEHVQRR